MRHLFLCLSLSLVSLTAVANCPSAKNIVRTAGENSWFSNEPGWEGGFYFPTPGNGYSTHVSHLLEAQWIQTTNIENNVGYVVCHYKGNFDDEIIRFTQSRRDSAKRPSNLNWNCDIKMDYPSVACTCTASESQCRF